MTPPIVAGVIVSRAIGTSAAELRQLFVAHEIFGHGIRAESADQAFELGNEHVVFILFQRALGNHAAKEAAVYGLLDCCERCCVFPVFVAHDFLYHSRELFAGKGVNEVDRRRRFSELLDQAIHFVDKRFDGVKVVQVFGFIDL